MEAGTSVADAYVALALRLRRLVPELVDAGAADPAVRRAIAAEPLPTAALLVREAGRLAEIVPDAGLDPTRERFLAGQLQAVEWRARRLAGQAMPFDREVRACLDVTAVPGEPDVYRAAHRAVDTLLPGTGPLATRLAAHRRRDAVPPERLAEAVRALAAALRPRVTARYGLPPDEIAELRLVADAPWSALQTYGGGYRSVVKVNTGAGLGASRLPRLVAHETYPGHHTECCRAHVGGRPELAVTVPGTPQTVVSEGLAEHALDVAVGPGWGPWSAEVLAAVGVHMDGELAESLAPVLEVLRRVRQDAALLLHGGGPSADAAAAAEEHLRRWLLLDAVRARRVVDALARPLWRTQVVAAVAGAQLVGERLDKKPDAVTEHRRMLDEPVLPIAVRS